MYEWIFLSLKPLALYLKVSNVCCKTSASKGAFGSVTSLMPFKEIMRDRPTDRKKKYSAIRIRH